VRLDRWGLVLSGVCLVHCLALPLSVLLLPTLSPWLAGHAHGVHWVLLSLALVVSSSAWRQGYRHHQQALVPVIGACGLGLMMLAVSHLLGPRSEVPLTLVGAAIVAVSHLLNLRVSPRRLPLVEADPAASRGP